MNRTIFLMSACLLIVLTQSFSKSFLNRSERQQKNDLNIEKFLERHNYYRSQLKIPDVEWSVQLAVYAQEWANKLAKNCQLQHRSTNIYGENIYMNSGKVDEYVVVDKWASEQQYFNHKNPVYQKGGFKYGHYSQVIWKETKFIGAAFATCKNGSQIWVCNYDPPGNMIGSRVY